jgi:hypothetical protein
MSSTVLDPRPGAAAFARRCRGRAHPPWAIGAAPTDPMRAEFARYWLLLKLLRRRRWAIHRHVHLVAAFEDAASRAPVTSMLSVGCGFATSELLLALDHPEVSFTLTDVDEEKLIRPREIVEQLGMSNVRFEHLDLLDPPALAPHDLVTSVEVLEHIADDRAAIATMVALSRRFVWALVPFCDERQYLDPRVRRIALERHEHVRPGYTHELLAERFAALTTVWERNCYFQPEAEQLRSRLSGRRGAKLLAERVELFELAARDVRSERVDDGRAATGVEILAEVPDRSGPIGEAAT